MDQGKRSKAARSRARGHRIAAVANGRSKIQLRAIRGDRNKLDVHPGLGWVHCMYVDNLEVLWGHSGRSRGFILDRFIQR